MDGHVIRQVDLLRGPNDDVAIVRVVLSEEAQETENLFFMNMEVLIRGRIPGIWLSNKKDIQVFREAR
jgi:hypothetical protein